MTTIEQEYKRAYDQAVRLLARRAYSTWELQRKLRQSKASTEIITQVCERCQALGYLSDADFALSRARYRLVHAHQGPRRIEAELRSLHIDASLIRQAFETLLTETHEIHWATVAMVKQFGTLPLATENEEETDQTEGDRSSVSAYRKEKKRRYDFLVRRGFNDAVIWQVLDNHSLPPEGE